MKPTPGYGQPSHRVVSLGGGTVNFLGRPVSPAFAVASVLKSLFMVQLLSRKNKKGAAFFGKDSALSSIYLVVWLTVSEIKIAPFSFKRN
ncbi:hypothetical protein HNQ56_003891 [Anaerotaenia torta]|uniref:hypothetical protein n=1 Tax=Anaerotaenia torta TaxID=433293 RepID=UPI003D1EAA48